MKKILLIVTLSAIAMADVYCQKINDNVMYCTDSETGEGYIVRIGG